MLVCNCRNFNMNKTKFGLFLLNLILCGITNRTEAQDAAQTTLFPYGTASGDTLAPPRDDDFHHVELLEPFVFFGSLYTTAFVGTNNLMSLGEGVSDYTATPFPVQGYTVFSLLWADARDGNIYYRATNDEQILTQLSTSVYPVASQFGISNFMATSGLIATWDSVPPYSGGGTNTFQCAIATDGTFSFAIYKYTHIGWTRSGSDDPHGQVGFNAGDGVNFHVLGVSQTAEVANLVSTSNVGVPGEWVFRVDTSEITGEVVFECETPTVAIPDDMIDGNSRQIIASVSATIQIDIVSYNCMAIESAIYTWTVHDASNTEVTSLLDGTDTGTVSIPALLLEYGVYTAQVTITTDVDPSLLGDSPVPSVSHQLQFEIIRSPLEAVIENSDVTLVIHQTQPLVLDASQSNDPDNLETPGFGLSYLWSCRQESPTDQLDLTNPASQVQSLCSQGEFTELTHTEQVLSLDMQSAINNGLASLPASYTYTFHLNVTMEGRVAGFDQRTVTVLQAPAPTITLTCSNGCGTSEPLIVARDQRVMFLQNCQQNCSTSFGALRQVWSLYAVDGGGNTLDDVNYVHSGGYIASGATSPRITIAPSVLTEGQQYEVQVTSSTLDSEEGSSSLRFWAGSVPSGGNCYVEPHSGAVFDQTFTITCDGWNAWSPPGEPVADTSSLVYSFYYVKHGTTTENLLISGASNTYGTSMLPVGSFDLIAVIQDEPGAKVRYSQNMQINVTESETGPMPISEMNSLLTTVDPSNPQQATEFMNAALSVLEVHSQGDSTEESSQEATAMREQMADMLLQVLIITDNLESLAQTATNLISNPAQASERLMVISSELLANMGAVFMDNIEDMAADSRKNMAAGLINGAGIMSVSTASMSNSSALNEALRATDTLISDIADSMTSILYPNENEAIETATITMNLKKANSSELYGQTQSIGGATFNLPAEANPGEDCMVSQNILSQGNTKSYGGGAENINANVLTINMVPCDAVDGSRRKRDTGDTEYSISLPVNSELIGVNNSYGEDTLIRHSLSLQTPRTDVLITVYPIPELLLDVYVRYNEQPTTTDYNQMLTVPIPVENMTVPDGATAEEIEDLQHSLHIPGTNLTNVTTLWIGVIKNSCESGFENCTTPNELLYKYGLVELTCRVWDELNEVWTSDYCQIEEGATGKAVKFKSSLLGSIGGGAFVGPNTIDFSTVFNNLDQKLVENAAVVGTVIGILVLFIPICILARYYDKKDKVKWSILPLTDNNQLDPHCYEVHVYTGLKGHSGTDSNINCIVAGTRSDSGIRSLSDGVRTNFQRGDVDSFLMTTPDSLGVPVTLRIWHDNSGEGKKADWYLSKIVVVDLSTDKWYMFMCDKWLSKDKEDGLIDRVIRVSSKEETENADNLLTDNLKRKLFDDHIWLSVGYRKTRSTFTRVQRACCCLSILYLTMIANAMWYRGGDSSEEEDAEGNQSALVIGPINMTVMQVYASIMSSIIVVPPILVMTLFFAKSKPRPVKKHTPKIYNIGAKAVMERDRIGSKGKTLPHWCIYLAYILVVLSVAVSAFFTILYAFEWGKKKSEAWLVAFILSFFESVMIIQPLKVFLIAMLLTFLFKKDSSVSELEENWGKMEDRDDSLKPASENIVTTQLTVEERRTIKKRTELDRKVKSMIREVVWQILLLALMCWVVTGNQSPDVYAQNAHMKNLFVPSLLVTRAQLVGWLENIVIKHLYNTDHYNGDAVNAYDNKFIIDEYAMRLGPPRLRLLRVKPERCNRLEIVRDIIKQCGIDYSSGNEDTNDYHPGWTRVENASLVNSESALDMAYIYQTEEEMKGLSIWGQKGLYSGGGYVANFGNSKTEALSLLDDLVASDWFNRYSRAMMLEFNVWNANTNLFNYIMILVEMPSEGSLLVTTQIDTIVLYRYVGAGGLLALFSEIILTIFVTVLLVNDIIKMVKSRGKYFHSFWNIVRLLSIALFYLGLSLYAWRSVLTASTVEEMMNNRGESINFQLVSAASKYYVWVLGLSAFLVQLGLLYILRYSKSIALMAQTLRESVGDLFNVMFCLLVVIFAFASFMYKHFGSAVSEYRSLPQALTTLVAGFIGVFDYQGLVQEKGIIGAVVLLFYLLLMMYFMLNIFISVLNDYIGAIAHDPEALPKDHEVMEYLMDIVKATVGAKGNAEELKRKQKLMEERRKQNKRNMSDSDTDKLLTRVNAIDTITSKMQPSPIANHVSKLLNKFMTSRIHGHHNDGLGGRSASTSALMVEIDTETYLGDEPQRKMSCEDLELIIRTAMLNMIKDEYMKHHAKEEGSLGVNDSGISSPSPSCNENTQL